MRRPKTVSGIAWCDKTWNPFQGCIKVSPGCKNCYMYQDKTRYGQDPAMVVRSTASFRAPLRWKTPQVVFACSWSDFFIAQADDWRPDAWEVIRQTPWHTYLILTKRPERIQAHLPDGWPWPHVWLGTSIETPAYHGRAEILVQVHAAHRFLSLEPLLADLGTLPLDGVHWVIAGGESGPRYRPMGVAWMDSIVRQCRAAQVPVFVKQDAALKPEQQGRLSAELWACDWTPPYPDAS